MESFTASKGSDQDPLIFVNDNTAREWVLFILHSHGFGNRNRSLRAVSLVDGGDDGMERLNMIEAEACSPIDGFIARIDPL